MATSSRSHTIGPFRSFTHWLATLCINAFALAVTAGVGFGAFKILPTRSIRIQSLAQIIFIYLPHFMKNAVAKQFGVLHSTAFEHDFVYNKISALFIIAALYFLAIGHTFILIDILTHASPSPFQEAIGFSIGVFWSVWMVVAGFQGILHRQFEQKRFVGGWIKCLVPDTDAFIIFIMCLFFWSANVQKIIRGLISGLVCAAAAPSNHDSHAHYVTP